MQVKYFEVFRVKLAYSLRSQHILLEQYFALMLSSKVVQQAERSVRTTIEGTD